MAWLAVAAIAGGTLLNSFAKMKAAKAESDALRSDADILRKQADELMGRTQINQEAILRSAQQAVGSIGVEQAASGVAGGGIALSQMDIIMEEAATAVINNRREAHFQREMMIRQGKSMDTQAANIRKNSKYEIFGGLLGGAGQAMGAYKPGASSPAGPVSKAQDSSRFSTIKG